MEPRRAASQEAHAHRDGQPAELAVNGAEGGVQFVAFLSVFEALATTPFVLDQGIADEADHEGERQNLLVAPAAVPVKDLIEICVIGDPTPEGHDSLRQRHPSQDLGRRDSHFVPPERSFRWPESGHIAPKLYRPSGLCDSRMLTAVVRRPAPNERATWRGDPRRTRVQDETGECARPTFHVPSLAAP
jgi:hypothetical protein